MSRQKYLNVGLLFLVFLMLWALNSCEIKTEEYDESSPIVQRGVEIKLNQLRANKEADCRAKALETAISRIDSLMASEAYGIKIDTLKRPDRKVKPLKPIFKSVPDTIKIKPIIENPKE